MNSGQSGGLLSWFLVQILFPESRVFGDFSTWDMHSVQFICDNAERYQWIDGHGVIASVNSIVLSKFLWLLVHQVRTSLGDSVFGWDQ